jgi:hypothetical protein
MQEEHIDGLMDHHEPRSSHYLLPFDAVKTTEVALPYSGGGWRLKTTGGSPSFPRSSACKDSSSGAVLVAPVVGSKKMTPDSCGVLRPRFAVQAAPDSAIDAPAACLERPDVPW